MAIVQLYHLFILYINFLKIRKDYDKNPDKYTIKSI